MTSDNDTPTCGNSNPHGDHLCIVPDGNGGAYAYKHSRCPGVPKPAPCGAPAGELICNRDAGHQGHHGWSREFEWPAPDVRELADVELGDYEKYLDDHGILTDTMADSLITEIRRLRAALGEKP